MIIWLASYPRSGNTYFRVLLKQCFGISTFSVYDDTPLAEKPQIRELVGHENRPHSIQALMDAKEIFLVKTHDLPQNNGLAIYLVRDGRDALVSYAHYIQTFENQTEVTRESFHFLLHDLIAYNASFGGWGPNVLAWADRTEPTVVIKFEALVQSKSPWKIVQGALEKVGYPISNQSNSSSLLSFDELHKQLPGFFREGKVGTWQNEMPTNLHDLFWEKHGDAMQKMGYTK